MSECPVGSEPPETRKMPAFALHIDSCKNLFEHFKLRKQTLQFNLIAIGSIITDLEEFGIMKNVHGNAEKFLQYMLKTDPKYAPLAVGMILHEELDRTIDKHHVNPHIQQTQNLLQKHQMKTEKLDAHYLIDHTVNCKTIEKQPQILKLAENIKKKITQHHAHKIAYHLTNYFGGNQQQIVTALETFRNFDLTQYLTPDTASTLFSKFTFMQQELIKEPRTLKDKIVLLVKYAKFMLTHRKHQIKQLCQNAKEQIKDHKHAYKKAQQKITKKFTKIAATYSLLMK